MVCKHFRQEESIPKSIPLQLVPCRAQRLVVRFMRRRNNDQRENKGPLLTAATTDPTKGVSPLVSK